MKTKKRKGLINAKKETRMFIPNVWLPANISRSHQIEHSVRSAFCPKDKVQWFYLIKNQRGLSDFEPVHCEFCKGDLQRDIGLESGFSASDTPEVIAWLEKHPSKSKTLVLVFTLFNLAQVKNNLQCHLQSHDFSGLYEELIVMESGLSLSKMQKRQTRKKAYSTGTLLSIIELKSKKEKRADYTTRLIAHNKIKDTHRESTEEKQRQKFSALAKGALKLLQQNTISAQQNYNKFKVKQKALSLQFRKITSQSVLKNLKVSNVKLSKISAHLESKALFSKRFSKFHREEALRRAKRTKKKTGRITNKILASSMRSQ